MAASAQQTNPQPPPQQPPPQRQPNPSPATQNLDQLQAMFNLVLITTGRFLREQQNGGGSGRMQFTMQRQVTAAKERFHDSLDQLEEQLQLAQAVVRRDLSKLQQERIKREQAEKAERQRKLAESSAAKQEGNMKKMKEDAGASAEAANTHSLPSGLLAQKDDGELNSRHQSPPPPIETSLSQARDPLFDETPLTTSAQDIGFDFDAEFGDGMNDHDNQDIDMNDAAPDLNLLAGLEDFAKSGDDNNNSNNKNTNTNHDTNKNDNTIDLDLDFTMPDLPDMNPPVDEQPPQTNAPPPSKPAQPPPPPPPASQNTSQTLTQQPAADTFNDVDMLGGSAANDDFEDLFNMDYIENPEDTQFNDAFFGYE